MTPLFPLQESERERAVGRGKRPLPSSPLSEGSDGSSHALLSLPQLGSFRCWSRPLLLLAPKAKKGEPRRLLLHAASITHYYTTRPCRRTNQIDVKRREEDFFSAGKRSVKPCKNPSDFKRDRPAAVDAEKKTIKVSALCRI